MNSKKMKISKTGKVTYNTVIKALAVFLICIMPLAAGGKIYAAGNEDKNDNKNESEIDGDKKPVEDVNLEEIYEEKGFLTEEDIENAVFEFGKKEYAVISGDTVTAGLKCNIPEQISRIEYSNTSGVLGLTDFNYKDKTVKIMGYYADTITVSVKMYVTYSDEDGWSAGEKEFTADCVVKVLPTFTARLAFGESYPLNYTDNDEYSDMVYVWESESMSGEQCVEFADNRMTAVAEGEGSIYLQGKDGVKIFVGYVYVTGDDVGLAETKVSRAVGSAPYQLILNNAEGKAVTWSSSNALVASVSQSGELTPVAVGATTITASIKVTDAKTMTYTCEVNITNPVLSVSSFNLAKGYSAEINITGTASEGSWSSSSKSIASVSSNSTYYSNNSTSGNYGITGTVYAKKKGTAVISVEIDGVIRTAAVTVTDPKIKKDFYIVTKGVKQVIKVTGTAKNSSVVFTSGNNKVATVTSKGIVRIKKTGFCPIIVDVDGARLIVSFNAGNKKAVKAVNNAIKVEGAIYSQARRMQKGYYDCSSLVWRSYKGTGMYFGDRHYAPVAANEAAYCVRTKKNVPVKYINKLNKLNVGDLIFYSRDIKNGRYKNIYHVAIYTGQQASTYGDKIYTYGRIVHADGSRVSQSSLYNESNCAVIGRPFK